MPTVIDLGQKVKSKYPGQYDDLSDLELGQKVKSKYPEYADFADVMPSVKDPATGQAIEVPGMPAPPTPPLLQPPPDDLLSRTENGIDRAAKSAATALNPLTLAKSLYQTVRHPLDTAQGIYEQGKEMNAQGDEDLASGHPISGTLRKVGSTIPVAGPVVNDLVTKATNGQAPEAIGEGVATAYQFGLPTLLGKRLSKTLTKSAEGNYLKVLAPDSKLTLGKAEEAAAMLAKDKPVALSRDSFTDQMGAKADAIGPQVGTQYSQTPLPVGKQNVQRIYSAIEDLRNKHVKVKGTNVSVNPNIAKALDDLESTVVGMEDTFGNISTEALDDFRDKLFRGNVNATGNLKATAPESAASIEKATARVIREVLDSQYPDEGAINNIYHLSRKAQEFSKSAGQTEKLRDLKTPTDLGSSIVRVVPQKVKLAANVFNSVPWNTVSGATKQTIAEYLASGKFDQAQKIMQSIVATKSAVNRIDPFADLTPEQRKTALQNIQLNGQAEIMVGGNKRMWRKQSDGSIRRLR